MKTEHNKNEDKILNIAVLAHSYLPVPGGIQTYIHNYARSIVKLGHNVHIIIPNNGLDLQPFSIIDGVNVHRTSVENLDWCYPVQDNSIGDWNTNKDYAGWGAQIMQFMMDALPIIKEYNIDIIHTHFTATPIGELFTLYHNIPYVDTVYGFYTDYLPSSDMRRAATNFYNNSNMRRLVVISQYAKDLCIKGGIPELLIDVVKPGIDFKRFNPEVKWGEYIRTRIGMEDTDQMILCPIRLQSRKGFAHAIKALPYVLKKYPDAVLIVTGGSSANPAGVEKPLKEYHQLAHELKVTKHTRLMINQIPDEEMPALYSSADIVLMPSLKEGFGISALEAQAMQKPVVASDIPAFRESMDDTAIFFETGNFKELAEKIIMLLDSKSLQEEYIKKGYERVIKLYDEKYLGANMLKVYKKILKESINL